MVLRAETPELPFWILPLEYQSGERIGAVTSLRVVLWPDKKSATVSKVKYLRNGDEQHIQTFSQLPRCKSGE